MKDKKDKKDIIIKIILIIIIILLLVHNCTLIKRRGKERTPSGNVNIIEITCENNNKCDEKDDDGKKDNTDGTGTDTTDGSGGTNRASNNNTGNGTDNTTPASNTDSGSNDDTDGNLKVLDSDVVWRDTTELKIFENSIYEFENVVAPEDSNTYEFIVKNSTKYNLKYNISFVETNPYNMNMKYKLKKNNTYIIDHYVSYDELIVNEQLLNAKNNDTFYLEWKWVSSDHDNAVGENRGTYQLKIDVKAESV